MMMKVVLVMLMMGGGDDNEDKHYRSKIHRNRIYALVTKNVQFDLRLREKNARCKSIGGYLVEFDDLDEQNFVAKFILSSAAGGDLVFIGAIDVESEGKFVPYNTKKPLTYLKWKRWNPDN
ncbi:collectin-11 [Plakobranchus ocellatus]|uniref:Collectin-11 n=1 Tax=Plakobranchus ocellatus TaxID=259542 RepID=A0AAV3Z582_9GAST|nr:collectin-11 [Plakobranchus ocellatus]